jgi:hypothetical protein
MNYPTQAELFSLIAKTEFKPLDAVERQTWAGCESENPLIGYNGEFAIIIDGENITISHGEDEFGGRMYNLNRLA